MKKLLLILACVIVHGTVFTQVWKESLDNKNQDKALTLFDYQEAFNNYWDIHEVVDGKYINEEGNLVKAAGWKQYKRWEHYWESRVHPISGVFPNIDINKINSTYQNNQRNTGGNWETVGPNASPGGYAGIGRLNCIQFHPSDANTFWVGAASGGIWVTTNGGTSWTVLNDFEQVLGVSDIVIPSDYSTSNTIYIATGDRDALDNRSIGVLKSTDAGATWNTTGLTFTVSQGRKTNRLLLDPNDNNTIIAATTNGVYKTTDGGAIWDLIDANSFVDLEYKPGNFNVLYGSKTNGEIHYSIDGGANWTLSQDIGNRIELAVSPNESDWVYAVVASSSSGLYGIYKSTNSGVSYTQVFDGLIPNNNLLGWDSDGGGTDGQGWYDLSIAVDPTNASTIYVGGINNWKSTDGGNNWSIATHWYGAGGYAEVHADQHNLNYNSSGVLFNCNDGGLYKTSDGLTWSYISGNMVISQIYKLGTSQTVADETINGLQDNGTKLRSNAIWSDVLGGDGMECLIDYTDANVQYGSLYYGDIRRTTDHWGDWTKISDNLPNDDQGAWVTPFEIDPNNNQTIYVGYEDLYKSVDRGDNFTKIGDFSDGTLRSMAIADSDPNYIYIATPYKIQRTTNGGGNWDVITNNLPTGSASIKYISIKYDDPNTIWVAVSSYSGHGVYESTNGGTSWTNISTGLPNIPTNTVIQNRQNTSIIELYAGTDAGVYIKEGSNDWEAFNANLPNVVVSELEIYYDDAIESNSKLKAATYGRGLWQSDLNTIPVGLPAVITNVPSNITTTTVDMSGEVTDDFGSSVTERGFVYNTFPSPTVIDNKVIIGSGIGEFNTTIENLISGNQYYIRSYAENGNGLSYGNQQTFSTTCDILTYTMSETFESDDFTPLCWDSFIGDNGIGNANNWTSTTDSYAGSKAAYIQYENVTGGDAEDWLVSSQISLGNNSSLSFYQKQEYPLNYGSNYHIKVSTTTQDDLSDFVAISSYDESTFSEDYSIKTIDLSAYDGQQVYIAFVMTNDDGDDWYIDNVEITSDIPSAPEATAAATSGCGLGSVTISSNLPGEQTFYLADELGTILDSQLADALFYEFIDLTDGSYTGKVERQSLTSALSDIVILTNELIPNQPDAIVGDTEICEGAEQTYSVILVDGVDYAWTVPAGWTGTSTTNTITVIAGNTDGIISVTPSNSCGNGPPQILSISIIELPGTPSEIEGMAITCIGDEQTYSVENISGTIYEWNIPDGWIGTSTTNSIILTIGDNSGEVSVTANNSCGQSEAQTLGVAVQTTPEQPSLITGETEVCIGAELTYSVENVPGTTYNWTLPDGWTGASTTNEILITIGENAGEIMITPLNDCGEGLSQSLMIETKDIPESPSSISGLLNICEGTTETYEVNTIEGVEFVWELPTGWSGSSNTNTIDITVGTESGLITVYAMNECGNSESQSIFIDIKNIPEQASAITGPDEVYQGDNAIAFEVSEIEGATNYVWSVHSSWILSNGQGTNQVIVNFPDIALSGNITVYGQNDCGNGIASALQLDVLPINIEKLKEAGINIYPNPVSQFLNIHIDKENSNGFTVRILTLNGKEIINKEISNSNAILNIENLAEGTYIIQIQLEELWYSTQIIIVK